MIALALVLLFITLCVDGFSNLRMTASSSITIDDIINRYKIVTYGQQSNAGNSLEVIDRKYTSITKSFTINRAPGVSLGISLLEAYTLKGDVGLVVVDDIIEGSCLEGKVCKGDALISISNSNDAVDSLEGMNFDRTVDILSSYQQYGSNVITVRRMVKRKDITVLMVGPFNEDAGNFTMLSGYSSNLRTALQSQNMKIYDERTARFDSPYQSGSNCGGEGTCGTCVIQVISGKEFLNERVRVEDAALRKQGSPPNYRWSCRTLVKSNEDVPDNAVVKIKLRPQSQSW